jgi:TIR domain
MSSLINTKQAINIFFCYSHRDKKMLVELKKYLFVFRQRGIIHTWDDGAISPGVEWEPEIIKNIDSADIILLLVSVDFIASEYIYGKEIKRALERHETGEARLVPIILRSVPWHYAHFGKLQALPTEGRPISSRRWANKDEAYTDVAEGIVNIIMEIFARREKI